MRLGINYIIKEDFLLIYYIAYTQSITEKNILSSFSATGLIPFNPDYILSTLGPIVRTPSPVSTYESIWESKTPHTMPEIKRQAKHIQEQRRLRKDNSKSPSDGAFNQLLKGFEVAVHERAILMAEVKELRAANKRQTRQRNQRRTTIADGGTLSISEGQNRVTEGKLEEQIQDKMRITEARAGPSQPKTRAAPRCSLYKSLEHNAKTCTIR